MTTRENDCRNTILKELAEALYTKDAIKARLVAEGLRNAAAPVVEQALSILSKAEGTVALPVLAQLAGCFDSSLNDAIRGNVFAKALACPSVVLHALHDREDEALEVYIRCAGAVGLGDSVDMLLEILGEDHPIHVLKATLRSLGSIGDPRSAGAVSRHLYDDESELVEAAVTALGEIGTPTAMMRLSERLGTDTSVDGFIMEVLTSKQDSFSLDIVNQSLVSHHSHLRNLARTQLEKIGPKAVPLLAQNLLHDDPDLLVQTLGVLGDIGDQSAIQPIRKLIRDMPEDPNVRFAAYEALGKLPMNMGAHVLAAGMTDPVEHVRAAAAAAINRNFDQMLATGIRNLVMERDADARSIILTVLHSQADAIFLSLVEDPFFQALGLNYLAAKAHPDLRTHFTNLLEANGYDELAGRLLQASPNKANRLRIVAVDDSKLALSIEKSALYDLGHDPVTFLSPVEALTSIREQKPDLVLTDLNMPDMTGVELVQAVREIYSADELPMIMVTTQSRMGESDDALLAGANGIMKKPFTTEELGAKIESVLARSRS